jgi:hypothetical protein
MCGILPPYPHTSSWLDAYLSTRTLSQSRVAAGSQTVCLSCDRALLGLMTSYLLICARCGHVQVRPHSQESRPVVRTGTHFPFVSIYTETAKRSPMDEAPPHLPGAVSVPLQCTPLCSPRVVQLFCSQEFLSVMIFASNRRFGLVYIGQLDQDGETTTGERGEG